MPNQGIKDQTKYKIKIFQNILNFNSISQVQISNILVLKTNFIITNNNYSKQTQKKYFLTVKSITFAINIRAVFLSISSAIAEE